MTGFQGRAVGLEPGAIRSVGIEEGGVNVLGAQHGAVKVAGLRAAPGAFQVNMKFT